MAGRPHRLVLDCTADAFQWRVHDEDGEVLAAFGSEREANGQFLFKSDELKQFVRATSSWLRLRNVLPKEGLDYEDRLCFFRIGSSGSNAAKKHFPKEGLNDQPQSD